MMSEQIRQEFTMDTSQAIQALNQLIDSFKNADGIISKFTQTLNSLNGAGKNSANAINQLAKETKQASDGIDKMSHRTKSLTISWETFARVVVTQAIVRALSSIRNEIRRSVGDLSEFQKKVAEIQSIGGGIETAGIVRAVSDQFSLDLSDVGAAYYQALSNQIPLDQSGPFMKSAATFAKAGVTDLESAINLLSGTLNAYGMDVNRTDEISSKFFKTIELGRTTASELANDFGRAAPIAAQLGVSFDELTSSLATITITGVKTNMAVTQLVGAMTAFIKPTTAMKDALKELGYPTGAAAVQALGFKGALEAVIKTTDGTMESIGRLSPRIRGLLGTLVLTGQGAQKAQKNLELIKKVNDDLASQKAAHIMATDAAQVEKEWNKIKNVFTTDIGGHILRLNKGLFDLVGGTENFTGTIKYAIPVIEAASVALAASYVKSKLASSGFLSVAAGSQKATAALTMFSRVAGAIPGMILAIGAGWAIGTAIRDALDGPSKALLELEKQQEKSLQKFREIERERLKLARETDQARLQSFMASTPKAYKEYEKEASFSRERFDDSIDAVTDFLNKVVDTKKRALGELTDAIKSMENEVKRSMERSSDLTARIEDRVFQRGIKGKSESEQLSSYIKRSEELIRRATAQMASDNVDRVLETFRRAEEMATRAEDIGAKGNSYDQKKSALAVDKVLKSQLAAERSLRDNTRQRAAAYQGLQASAQKSLNLSEKQLQKASKLLSKLKEQGSLKPFEHEELQKILGQFGFNPEIHFNSEKAVLRLDTELRSHFKDYALEVGIQWKTIENLEAFLGRQISGPKDLNETIVELARQSETQRQAESKYEEAQEGILNSRERIAQLLSEIPQDVSRNFVVNPQGSWGSGEETQQLINKLRELSQQSTITREDVVSLGEQFEKIKDDNMDQGIFALIPGQQMPRNVQDLLANLGQAWLELDKIQQAQQVQAPGENQFGKLFEQLTQGAANLGPTLSNSFQPGVTKTQEILGGFNSVEAKVNSIGQQIQQWSTQSPEVHLRTSSDIPVTQLFGGRMSYYASGGYARGTDVIPAMLSPRESVLNARATERFFPQIQAMNAGIRPVFRQSGGSVTNIGDISVSVNESQTPQQTARQVLSSIRRELRRGSSRLI